MQNIDRTYMIHVFETVYSHVYLKQMNWLNWIYIIDKELGRTPNIGVWQKSYKVMEKGGKANNRWKVHVFHQPTQNSHTEWPGHSSNGNS